MSIEFDIQQSTEIAGVYILKPLISPSYFDSVEDIRAYNKKSIKF